MSLWRSTPRLKTTARRTRKPSAAPWVLFGNIISYKEAPLGVYSTSWIPTKYSNPRDRSTYTAWKGDCGEVYLYENEWVAKSVDSEILGRFDSAGKAMGFLFDYELKK
jgi:hypothetical protein